MSGHICLHGADLQVIFEDEADGEDEAPTAEEKEIYAQEGEKNLVHHLGSVRERENPGSG